MAFDGVAFLKAQIAEVKQIFDYKQRSEAEEAEKLEYWRRLGTVSSPVPRKPGAFRGLSNRRRGASSGNGRRRRDAGGRWKTSPFW